MTTDENWGCPRHASVQVSVSGATCPGTSPRRAKGSGGRPHKGAREFLGFRVDAQSAEAIDGARERLGAYRSDWIAAALTVAQRRAHTVAALVRQSRTPGGGAREYLATRVAPALFIEVERSCDQHHVLRNAWLEAALEVALEHEDEVAATWRHARVAEKTRRGQITLEFEEAYNRST